MPVRRALVVPRLADKGASDHTADGVLAGEDLAGDAAGVVELVERDRLLVRSDLEHRIRRRVHDPLARLLVLLPQLLDDLRPRRGPVAQHAAAGPVHEGIDHLEREAVRVRGQRLGGDDAHHLPVSERRVLSLRALDQPPGDGRCAGHGRAALQRLDVAEPERLQVWQVEAADRLGDVPERVRAFISELGRIG